MEFMGILLGVPAGCACFLCQAFTSAAHWNKASPNAGNRCGIVPSVSASRSRRLISICRRQCIHVKKFAAHPAQTTHDTGVHFHYCLEINKPIYLVLWCI